MVEKPRFRLALLAPRYWFTWLGFGIWYLIAQLPYGFLMFLGRMLGRILYHLVKRRVAIIRLNLSLCFPKLNEFEVENLTKKNAESVGKAFFETGIAWFLSPRRLRKLFDIEGLDELEKARDQGQGVMLFAMHFTHLDLGASMLMSQISIDGSYRPHLNPVVDYLQFRQRSRHFKDTQMISRHDVRDMVRSLEKGRIIWYAPDQDYGAKNSVFAPFFGIQAATVTATSKFARITNAKLIPFTHFRREDGRGYKVKILPAVDNFPSDNAFADARKVNQIVENCILQSPEQYLWAHRRFKTRPPGEADFYSKRGIAAGTRDYLFKKAEA